LKLPLQIQQDGSLKRFNTFGVEARSKWLLRVQDGAPLPELLDRPEWRELPMLPLGAGSNVLFTRDFDGVVVHYDSHDAVEFPDDVNERGMRVRCGAGRNWHDFLSWALDHGHAGLENLALIPGTVGGAPVQNIGAYGVELERCVDAVEAYDRSINALVKLPREECGFGYRTSRFKGAEAIGRYLITAVEFRFNRQSEAVLGYPGVQQELSAMNASPAEPHQIAEAICRIRRRKLPDPAELGNAGSFFKNPLIDAEHAEILGIEFPTMPRYVAGAGQVKLSAAWMLDHLGLKGSRNGDAGFYPEHALVLVNYGAATGRQLLDFAESANDAVEASFGFRLEPEVLIL
jgi:UDP-N-acetylmuramate dehydrogenase